VTPSGSRPRRLFRSAAAIVILAAGLSSFPPATRSASLTLSDGRVLQGREVRREGDVYLLGLDGGTVIPVPVDLVVEVGVTAAEPAEPPPPPRAPGVTYAPPQVLAGRPVEPPSTQDQLAVFGEPARFQQDIVHSNLGPSYWVMDPDEHNFNPSKWAQAPTDPNWQPTSAFDPGEDALADSRSTWQKAPIDSTWVPQDGFRKTQN